MKNRNRLIGFSLNPGTVFQIRLKALGEGTNNSRALYLIVREWLESKGIKDNVETSNLPTTGGSLSLEGYVPANDAPIVTKLEKTGAIILAKVNLHEFAVAGETVSSILGQTKNPYDFD